MKPGYKTTEFWLTLFAGIMPIVAGVAPKAAATIGGVATAVYAASRAYAKAKTAAAKAIERANIKASAEIKS